MNSQAQKLIILASLWFLLAPPASTSAESPKHDPRRSITNTLGMKLVLIPQGEYVMGAPEGDDLARSDEKPRHRVVISRDFYLGAHEVTVGQFRAFVDATGFKTAAETDDKGTSGYDAKRRGFEYNSAKYSWRNTGYRQADNHPVVNINWYDAQAFCQWLSKKEGRTYRLPTEAEWEYACRAGTTTRFTNGDEVKGLKAVANSCDQSLKKWWDTSTVKKYGLDPKNIQFYPWEDGHPFTAPVGSFQANALGLYDMLGNAGEFCADGYDAEYYGTSPVKDPMGPGKKTKGHVVRGGTFLNDARLVRVTSRVECPNTYRNYVIGFRVVLEKKQD
jgi:sulfatase modifying factor 1